MKLNRFHRPLILGLAILSLQAGAEPALATPAATAAVAAPRPVAQTLKLTDAKQRFEIDASYPQLQSPDAAGQAFNQLMRSRIEAEVAEFKKNAAEGMAFLKDPAVDPKNFDGFNSSLLISYETARADSRVISVALMAETFVIGNAHPSHWPMMLNYDLARRKEIKLADLFKPGTNYLQTLAPLCKADLKRQAKQNQFPDIDDMISEGTAPKAENYRSFTLTPTALVIAFPEYQAGPYVYGQHEVTIPYTRLQAILARNGLTLR